jgi:hypothetical protein
MWQKNWTPPRPLAPWGQFLGFLKFFKVFFEGYSADMCGENFPLVSMGGWAEGLALADPGVFPFGPQQIIQAGQVVTDYSLLALKFKKMPTTVL